MSQELTLFSKDLAAHEKSFKSVLPGHIPVKKFMRTVVGAVQNNPDILKCSKDSIMTACQKAAQDGLVIDGREAALVKFGNVATYMPMVAGVLKKLRNSGSLSTIDAVIVCEKDDFSYNPGTGELVHSPDWFGDRGEAIGVYAIAVLKDGGKQIAILNQVQLEKIRQVSRAKDRGPWKDWKEEMWAKSALRKLAKLLPSSADVDQMFDHDNDNYDLDDTPSKPSQEKTVDEINADLKESPPANVDTDTGEVIDGDFEETENPSAGVDDPI